MARNANDKGFVWYSLRVSFWAVMILSLFLILNLKFYDGQLGPAGSGLILFLLLPFNFVISLIHLFKHKEKLLASISLIASIIGIAFLTIGILGLMALS